MQYALMKIEKKKWTWILIFFLSHNLIQSKLKLKLKWEEMVVSIYIYSTYMYIFFYSKTCILIFVIWKFFFKDCFKNSYINWFSFSLSLISERNNIYFVLLLLLILRGYHNMYLYVNSCIATFRCNTLMEIFSFLILIKFLFCLFCNFFLYLYFFDEKKNQCNTKKWTQVVFSIFSWFVCVPREFWVFFFYFYNSLYLFCFFLIYFFDTLTVLCLQCCILRTCTLIR